MKKTPTRGGKGRLSTDRVFLFATQTEDTHALRLKSKLGFLEVQERNRRIVVLCRSVHSLRALLACRAASIIAALGCQPGEKTLINRFFFVAD